MWQIRLLMMVAALLMTGVSLAAGVEGCLDGCDASYGSCRETHGQRLCHERRASCIDRCDAQRTGRDTMARRLQSGGELDHLLKTARFPHEVSCSSECNAAARQCLTRGISREHCGQSRLQCLSGCESAS